MDLYQRDKKAWVKKYVYGIEPPTTIWINFGKRFAEAIEFREHEHDFDIELVKKLVPDYKEREKRIEVILCECGFVGILDGYSKGMVGEYKTGKEWTQDMVDQSAQLTFYAWLVFKTTGKIPKIELTWLETTTQGRSVMFTGNVQTFKSSRSKGQLEIVERKAVRLYGEMVATMKKEVQKL